MESKRPISILRGFYVQLHISNIEDIFFFNIHFFYMAISVFLFASFYTKFILFFCQTANFKSVIDIVFKVAIKMFQPIII